MYFTTAFIFSCVDLSITGLEETVLEVLLPLLWPRLDKFLPLLLAMIYLGNNGF